MAQRLFAIMQVADLPRSREFFTAIGLRFDPDFTNDNFASMQVGDAQVILHIESSFEVVTRKRPVDTQDETEAVFGIFVDSRDDVEHIVDRAVSAGGREHSPPWDANFFYQRVFEDLDGHQWEICWVKNAPAS
ncbi:hypothetical protein BBK82_37920 [Lentzea guizhouensis]|uniref:VOC domain-containing protein n=1 Tax=Lentzea guizhouensis TaxID=1586287 RepID=A0A1B2I034_9PSEU|nr:VOC family protein [Lentzea guizhouensis]ANZ43359.1 hypothetical protein BBK82_37920 [Lentzea guizhouensis]